LDSAFVREAKLETFRQVYLEAVADRELTEEEERELAHVRGGLEIPEGEIREELETVERLRTIRRIRGGELPAVEPGVPLPEGERCHFAGPARLLKHKVLESFQRDRVRYRVRGFVIEREGTLLLTNRRLLLLHEGSTSIPLRKVLDLEVDCDRNLLTITKDGAKNPLFLTTPEALRAGAVLAALAGL
jgi:hypothetical protein